MAPQAGQQSSARDRIPLLICRNFVELRGFEPLTPSMPWRCATSCATAPRGLARMSLAQRPDIPEPHQHRGEILPCRGDDFDLTRLLDGNRAQAGADGPFLQLAGGGAGQGRGERGVRRALEEGQAVAGPGRDADGLRRDGSPALLRLPWRHYSKRSSV